VGIYLLDKTLQAQTKIYATDLNNLY